VVRHILDEGMRGAAALQQQQQQHSGQQLSTPVAAFSAAERGPTAAAGGVSYGLMYSWHNKRYLGAAHGEGTGRGLDM